MGSRALNKPISLQTNLVSRRTYIRNQRRSLQPIAAIPTHDIINLAHIDLDAVQAQINSISHMLTLGYEPVVLPCSSMNCGDAVYRSTLDPVLRRELKGINPQGVALLALIGSYLFAKPGVLPGLVDMYISVPLSRLAAKPYSKDDLVLGKKIATGGFGTVFEAMLTEPTTGEQKKAIVKKAVEFGEAEVWMNERIMRSAPHVAATFLTGFSADDDARVGEPLWLVWTYEGASTLADLMMKKEFPYNLETLLFERALKIPEGPDRKASIIKAAFQQLLEGLEACHKNGIVHRDIKPQNCIVSEADRRVKLIDFGAAADLRIGINYVPNQYLLDPRFAPPQQYIMSSQTPRAPPPVLAAILSPVLWRLNSPDRFDMWSVGMILLQMAFPPLRTDSGLVAFNRALSEQHNWDLNAWRRAMIFRGSKEYIEGFAVLDALGGGGWDLVTQLVTYKPQDRLSATAALAHPWFDPSPFGAVAGTVENLSRVANVITEVDDGWLGRQIAKSESGGFTEVQLKEEFSGQAGRDEEEFRPQASQTLAWWKQRAGEQAARRQRLTNTLPKEKAAAAAVPEVKAAAVVKQEEGVSSSGIPKVDLKIGDIMGLLKKVAKK